MYQQYIFLKTFVKVQKNVIKTVECLYSNMFIIIEFFENDTSIVHCERIYVLPIFFIKNRSFIYVLYIL